MCIGAGDCKGRKLNLQVILLTAFEGGYSTQHFYFIMFKCVRKLTSNLKVKFGGLRFENVNRNLNSVDDTCTCKCMFLSKGCIKKLTVYIPTECINPMKKMYSYACYIE